MLQEQILEAIDDHVGQMRSSYHWFFPIVALCFFALMSGNDPISLMGTEIARSNIGFILCVCVAFYTLRASAAVNRISALLGMLDDAHGPAGLAILRLKSWTGNPFASIPSDRVGVVDAKTGSFLFGLHIGLAMNVISLCYIHSEDWSVPDATVGLFITAGSMIILTCCFSDCYRAIKQLESLSQDETKKAVGGYWNLLIGYALPFLIVIVSAFNA